MAIERELLATQFEEHRGRLRAVAYRMLGSHVEADDAVQETWLRLDRGDAESVDNLGGWLTTVTSRVCLDRLRSRRTREAREHTEAVARDAAVTDPAERVELAESVGAALLVVLDALGPDERIAFVLHDVFAVPFDEIAGIIGKSPDATRQLASRARRRVQGGGSTEVVDLVRHREIVTAFLDAAQGGRMDELLRLLHPDVELRPDDAAIAMGSLRPTRGAAAVAGALSGGAQAAQLAVVGGVTSLVWAPGGRLRGVIRFTVEDDVITALDVVGDVGDLLDDVVVLPH